MENKFYLTKFSVKKHSFWEFLENKFNFPKSCYAIGFVRKGQVQFIFGNQKITVNEGETVVIPKGSVYTSRFYGSPKIKFFSVSFDVKNARLLDNTIHILPYSPDIDKKTFKKLLLAYENNFNEAKFIFSQLFGRLFSEEEESFSKDPVLNAKNFISKNCCLSFDLKDLARLYGMGETKFYELFKAQTGHTPTEYKTIKKIQLAEELLSQTSLSVSEISEKLNFSSPAYFRKVFKEQTSKTPTEYKETSSEI